MKIANINISTTHLIIGILLLFIIGSIVFHRRTISKYEQNLIEKEALVKQRDIDINILQDSLRSERDKIDNDLSLIRDSIFNLRSEKQVLQNKYNNIKSHEKNYSLSSDDKLTAAIKIFSTK